MTAPARPSGPRAALLLALLAGAALAADRRPVTLDDYFALRDVGDVQVSPDGDWVAYAVSAVDEDADAWTSDVWMSSWDGRRRVQLTHTDESESTPRWSPDGRYLAFLADRDDPEGGTTQLWLLPRDGGEAERVTDFPGGVLEYDWSPDGRRLALIVADEDPAASLPEGAAPPPIVIDRFYFKEDVTGYLGDLRRHLYVLDLATREAEILTPGDFDEIRPAWSPDGTRIAFVSKRTGDWDRNNTCSLFTIEPRAGAAPKLLATFEGDATDTGTMQPPEWSPDSRSLAIIAGPEPRLIYYGIYRLAVVPAEGGAPRVLTPELDRNVTMARWSADGRSLFFLVEDDRNQHVARVPAKGGAVQPVTTGRREVLALDVGPKDRLAVLQGLPEVPYEVYALERGRERPLSRQNDSLLAGLDLAKLEEIEFASRDGTRIAGFLVRPKGYVEGRRYPAVLDLHGGPASQYANSFWFEWQLFAAQGYAIIGPNPRGSSGRGEAFAMAIHANWGDKDVQDVLAAVDHAVAMGVADPARLGVGGWSYGGILTNYVIASDTRFKAAVSGAGASNILAGYGTDMYVREYENELGPPWKTTDTWLKLSYPFLHADRIRTPTLFLCGQDDFNVPLLNSEQMYQALRSLEVPTQLVIYPGQFHGLDVPSYARDRFERNLAWFAKYLQ
jgi:dipeptidyl aminopeptidase/acylaminoacyl peptidase